MKRAVRPPLYPRYPGLGTESNVMYSLSLRVLAYSSPVSKYSPLT
nr:unnamed protein product [Callosobruchus chinensis]